MLFIANSGDTNEMLLSAAFYLGLHRVSQYSKHGSRRGGGGGGGQGVKTPLKNHKNIGFLSNTCPDPLKNHKATKPDSMLGHHRQDSEMPFKWHFTGRLIMARM